MADCALELSFDERSATAVEDQWRALRFLGLPSQLDHRGMTNAPHLSLVVASAIPDDVVARAREFFAAALPIRLDVRGLIAFGAGSRVTLAHLAEPPRAVVDEVTALRQASPRVRHPVWTPHVTLGRRIPRDRLGEATAAVDARGGEPAPDVLVADRLRWWDPATATIDVLARA